MMAVLVSWRRDVRRGFLEECLMAGLSLEVWNSRRGMQRLLIRFKLFELYSFLLLVDFTWTFYVISELLPIG